MPREVRDKYQPQHGTQLVLPGGNLPAVSGRDGREGGSERQRGDPLSTHRSELGSPEARGEARGQARGQTVEAPLDGTCFRGSWLAW